MCCLACAQGDLPACCKSAEPERAGCHASCGPAVTLQCLQGWAWQKQRSGTLCSHSRGRSCGYLHRCAETSLLHVSEHDALGTAQHDRHRVRSTAAAAGTAPHLMLAAAPSPFLTSEPILTQRLTGTEGKGQERQARNNRHSTGPWQGALGLVRLFVCLCPVNALSPQLRPAKDGEPVILSAPVVCRQGTRQGRQACDKGHRTRAWQGQLGPSHCGSQA